MSGYLTLVITALLPAIFVSFFVYLDSHTIFSKLPYKAKQVIYGIVFGGLAVIGTEYGAPINGAQMNTRDAAVLTAGLLFGGPAGIIAGIIGGVERYVAVNWGIGTFTQVACSVSTIIAGFYSAVLRKLMFDDENPGWLISFAIGLVMEVFHMTMVFITNMSDTEKAMAVVKTCSIVMIPANSLSVMLSAFTISCISRVEKKKHEKRSIASIIQSWLVICVTLAFALTTAFTFKLQDTMASNSTNNIMSLAIVDVENDIEDASDENLLNRTIAVAEGISEGIDFDTLLETYGVKEINIMDSSGIIVESSDPSIIGFDMNSGEQAREFLQLLGNTQTYVQEYGPISMDSEIYRKYAGVKYYDGFVQVGYGAEEFQADISEEVKTVVKNRHVGNTGYMIVADSNGYIINSLNNMSGNIGRYGLILGDKEDEMFTSYVNGTKCHCMYSISEGYYIISIMPDEEVFSTRNVALYSNTFMEILVFALMFGCIYMLINAVVVKNINKINASLDKITDGDLEEKADVMSNQEFASLSNDINETVNALKESIKEASERINAELEYAKNIQTSALPHIFPESKRIELFALMEPAKGVGGDFYDFFKTRNDVMNFMIADVSGKGIPGAMFMMRSKTQLHSLTETGIDVNEVFTMGNNSLCEGNDAGMFVTAWQAAINLKTGFVQFANAGHNPPVVKRVDGTCEFIRGKVGFVLAGMEGVKYKMQELQLNPGDILFLYTDGVVEATDNNNQLYGDDRLIECLKNIDKDATMDWLCCEVIGDVGRFVGDAEQFDDITMLAIRYLGDNPEE